MKEADVLRLEHSDMSVMRWTCNVTLKYRKSSPELRERLDLDSIRNCIRRDRVRWFGHVERCSDDSVMKKYRDIVDKGQQREGTSRKIWYQLMDSDLRSLKIDRDLARNRTK